MLYFVCNHLKLHREVKINGKLSASFEARRKADFFYLSPLIEFHISIIAYLI